MELTVMKSCLARLWTLSPTVLGKRANPRNYAMNFYDLQVHRTSSYVLTPLLSRHAKLSCAFLVLIISL